MHALAKFLNVRSDPDIMEIYKPENLADTLYNDNQNLFEIRSEPLPWIERVVKGKVPILPNKDPVYSLLRDSTGTSGSRKTIFVRVRGLGSAKTSKRCLLSS